MRRGDPLGRPFFLEMTFIIIFNFAKVSKGGRPGRLCFMVFSPVSKPNENSFYSGTTVSLRRMLIATGQGTEPGAT